MEIIDEKPITISEVKEILTKRDKNLTTGLSEQEARIFNKAKNYVIKFSKLSSEDAKGLKEKIKELNLNLSEENIVKIVDILPKTPDELRTLFSKEEKFKYNEEEIKKILDCIAQYV